MKTQNNLDDMVGSVQPSRGSKAKKGIRNTLLGFLLGTTMAACDQIPVTISYQTATQKPAIEQTYTPEEPTEEATYLPTETATLEATVEPTATYTLEPTATVTPSPTPTPINYVTLGSPFAEDCGDGIPRIWSNDSFNGPFKPDGFDNYHGHVDIFVPTGCNVETYSNEVLAPVSGLLQPYSVGEGYHLFLNEGHYLAGIEEALRFAGVKNPNLSLVSGIWLNLGHLQVSLTTPITVTKGQPIGDIVPVVDHNKLAYQISINYGGIEYMFSPTVFSQNDPQWICVINSPYDCIAEPNDYPN